jgi:hypothetical protein
VEAFLKQLARIRDQFEWRLEPDEGHGSERREWARFQIRAFSDQPGTEDVAFDPIGAVCFAMTGTVCGPDSWTEAAELIGLPLEEAQRLAEAANDKTWQETDSGRRRPNTDLQALRVDLIRAVESPAGASL